VLRTRSLGLAELRARKSVVFRALRAEGTWGCAGSGCVCCSERAGLVGVLARWFGVVVTGYAAARTARRF